MMANLNLRNDIAKYLCLDELVTLNKSGTDRFGGPYDRGCTPKIKVAHFISVSAQTPSNTQPEVAS